jgi:hypothetical protein
LLYPVDEESAVFAYFESSPSKIHDRFFEIFEVGVQECFGPGNRLPGDLSSFSERRRKFFESTLENGVKRIIV